jgi:hypothetical protein
MLKWIADRIAARRKLSPAGAELYEQRGTLLASGFIAGEAIFAIIISVVFIAAQARGVPDFSFTHLFTGVQELGIYRDWGAWLSLIVFGMVAWVLVGGPFKKGLPD